MGLGEAGLFFEVANGLHDLWVAVAAEPADHLAHCTGLPAVVPDGLGEGVVGVGEVFKRGDVGVAAVAVDILSRCEFKAISEAGEKVPKAAA